MADLDAIATALATRFDGPAVTPPAGESDPRSSSANAPNELGALPCVVVFADAGGYRTGNGTRIGVHTFPVRFYLSETMDIERESARLRTWATVLQDQLRTSVTLSGTCDRATVQSYQLGILRYAGRSYAGVELRVEVETTEGWAASA